MEYKAIRYLLSGFRTFRDVFVFTALYLACIAVAEAITVIVFLDAPLSLAPIVIGLIVFSIYVNDQLVDLENGAIVGARERAFVARHDDLLYALASVTYGIALSLSVWGGVLSFAIALLPGIAWILYASDLISRITSWIGIGLDRVQELFLVNTGLVAFAWAATLLFIPIGYAGAVPAPVVVVLFAYVFLRVFKNTEVSNVPDRENDRERGNSTLATVLGVERTRWVLHGLDAATAAVLLVGVRTGALPAHLSLALFAGLLYGAGVSSLVGRLRDRGSLGRLAEYEYLVAFGVLAAILAQRNPQFSVAIQQLMPLTIAAFLMVSIGIGISAGLLAWREYPEPGALPLTVMLAGQSWWSVTLFLEFQATAYATKVFLADVRWVGIVLIPVGWLLFSLEYTGWNRYLQPRYVAAILVVPVLTVFLALTGEFNSLLYGDSELVRRGGLAYLSRDRGPWFWVITGYTYLLGLLGAIPLLGLIRGDNLLFRGQSTALLVGIAAPWASNALFLVGVFPFRAFDPTPLAFGISGVAYLGALTQFQLLGSSPTPSRSARRAAYERMGQGAIVVDRNDFIIDLNAEATRLLEVPAEEALGADAHEIVPDYARFPDDGSEGDSVVIRDEEGGRTYEATVSTITDPYGRTTSRIVTLSDITDIIEREQRISVLNRILRHNIRNELNVVDGHLELLEEQGASNDGQYLERARQSTRRVIRFADRARHVEETLRENGRSRAVPVSAVAERVVAAVGEENPDAVVEYDPSDDAELTVRVADDQLLELALTELVENAVVHNDRDPARVTVRAAPEGERVRIDVVDNGPGIPAEETAVLSTRSETNLEHSSGLGLWLVKWTISLSGGDLAFGENDPRGSVVTVTLPAGDG